MLIAVLVALSAGEACAPVSASEAVQPAEPQRVLVIFPTEQADPIAVLLEQGVRDALRTPDGSVAPPVVYTEYLEMSRLPEPALQRAQPRSSWTPTPHTARSYRARAAPAQPPDRPWLE